MKFPPTYVPTDQISNLLREFDILKAAFALMPVPEGILKINREKAILKSALFSARIEGNPLTLGELTKTNNRSIKKKEVNNISHGIEYIQKNSPRFIDEPLIRMLHSLILDGISADAGHFRMEDSAIFNQAGIAAYLTPAYWKIPDLMALLYQYCNDFPDSSPIKAAIAHIWFEKIHPFMDGNGRVGRLVSLILLRHGGYDLGGLVSFEEYLDSHRQAYYDALGKDTQDIIQFVEFFLHAIVTQAKQGLEELKNTPTQPNYPALLPRRGEILNIIENHRVVSFDFLKRRFRLVPESTLHNDLAHLLKQGHIQKLGSTRGAVYASKHP